MKRNYFIQPVHGWAVLIAWLLIRSSYAQSEANEAGENNTGKLISWWSFDDERGHSVWDKIQQKRERSSSC